MALVNSFVPFSLLGVCDADFCETESLKASNLAGSNAMVPFKSSTIYVRRHKLPIFMSSNAEYLTFSTNHTLLL